MPRPAWSRLDTLDDDGCRELLDDLQTMNLGDERSLWEILGLAVPLGTAWKGWRIGEWKNLLQAYDKLLATGTSRAGAIETS